MIWKISLINTAFTQTFGSLLIKTFSAVKFFLYRSICSMKWSKYWPRYVILINIICTLAIMIQFLFYHVIRIQMKCGLTADLGFASFDTSCWIIIQWLCKMSHFLCKLKSQNNSINQNIAFEMIFNLVWLSSVVWDKKNIRWSHK